MDRSPGPNSSSSRRTPAPSQAELQLAGADPRRRVGRYLLLETLGSGGFGTVWRAWDPQLRRSVAVKLLTRAGERARQRFAREVHAVARLRHPAVVALHESGEVGGVPSLVMELVDGRPLSSWCDGRRTLAVGEVVRVLRDAARAIAYAHGEGVLHRDLKPDNILLDTEGQVCVLDFGLAALLDLDGERLSNTGVPLGTPAYMAPEQVRGERPDARSDVWGLGATLYQALTGQPPWPGELTPVQLYDRRPPVPPSQVDPEVDRALDPVVLRCLELDPARRYREPGALADDLEAFLSGGLQARSRAARRSRLGWRLLALGALGAAGAWGLAPPRGAPPPSPGPTPPPASSPSPASASPAPDEPVGVGPAVARARLAQAADRSSGRAPWAEVDQLYERALEAAGEAPGLRAEIERARAEFALRRRKPAIALEIAERLLQAQGSSPELFTLRGQALFALDSTDPRQLLALCQEQIQRDPQSPYATAAQGLLACASGELSAGLAQLERASAQVPSDRGLRLLLAHFLVQADQPREARRVAAGLLEEHGDDWRAYMLQAQAALSQGDAAPALAALEQALSLAAVVYPADRQLRGFLRLQTGDLTGAREDLDAVLSAEPGNLQARISRARVLLHERDAVGAEAEIRRAAQQAGGEALAEGLRRLPLPDRFQLYALSLGPLVALTPEREASLRARVARVAAPAREACLEAWRLACQGRPWLLIGPVLQRASEQAPKDPELALEAARLAAGRDVYDVARAALRSAEAGGAPALEVARLSAEVALRQGRFPEAGAALVELARRDPDGVAGLWARATLLVQRGEIADAAAPVREALALAPDDVPCRMLACLIADMAGDGRGALEAVDALLADGGWADSRVAYARYHLVLGDVLRHKAPGDAPLDEAAMSRVLNEFEQVSVVSEGAAGHLLAVRFFLQTAALFPGDRALTMAEAHLETARRREPGRVETRVLTGWAALERGDPERALELWRGALAKDPCSVPDYVRATWRRRMGSPVPLPPQQEMPAPPDRPSQASSGQ